MREAPLDLDAEVIIEDEDLYFRAIGEIGGQIHDDPAVLTWIVSVCTGWSLPRSSARRLGNWPGCPLC